METTNWKAYASTALTFIGGILAIWVGDEDPFTKKEFVQAVLTSAIGAGVVGGATWAVPYSRKKV